MAEERSTSHAGMRRLFRRVALRQQAASAGVRFYVAFVCFSVLYVLLLACARLLAVIPDWFEPVTFAVVPGAALLVGLLFRHRPRVSETARAVDRAAGTDDLFLTATSIGEPSLAYETSVLERADERSPAIRPDRVVAFRWGKRVRNLAIVAAVVLAGVLFLPQFDPFGREAERQQAARQRRDLEQTRKATAMRAELLKEKQPDAEHSKTVEATLDDLMASFREMKPQTRDANLRKLSSHQAELGKLWRKVGEGKLRQAFDRAGAEQRFGGGDAQRQSRWRRQLRRGEVQGVKEEMAELKEMAEKIEQVSDGAEKQSMRREMNRRLKSLADFMSREANSEALASALNRAMRQCSLSQSGGMSQEAMRALQESLDLAALEADALGQSMRDMQALEEALRAAQLAKRLNSLEKLDGAACEGCQGIADYAQLYEELMKNAGKGGGGGGMGDEGIGRGGIAPEDNDIDTAFQPEKSKTSLTAGKMLLQWKTRELSTPGVAREDYVRGVERLRDGVSEAILHEQVPPGYHEAVKKYFDALKEAPAPPGTAARTPPGTVGGQRTPP